MKLYIAAIAASVLIAWIGTRTTAYRKRKRHWVLILLSALPLILLIGLRHYSIGIDSPAYYRWFYRIRNGIEPDVFEWLYVWLNKVIGKFDVEYTALFLACAAIFCLPIFCRIFDDSPDIIMSIFLFWAARYYFVYFNLVRQMLSAAILLYSIRFIERKDLKRFILCVVIAAGFHSSAYAFAILYFISEVKIEPKAIALGSVLVMALSRTPLIAFIVRIMSDTKYEGYAESEGNSFAGLKFSFLVLVAVLIIALLYYEDSRRYRIYLNSQILAVWATSMIGTVQLIERMRFTFGLPSIILLPMAVNNIKDKRAQTLVRWGVIIGFGIYGYLCLRHDPYNMMPYRLYNR